MQSIKVLPLRRACGVGGRRCHIGGHGSYPYMVVLIFCVVVAVLYLLYALRVLSNVV
jgi:hypothetical protein